MILPILLVLAAFVVLVLEVFFVSFGVLTAVAVGLAAFGVVLGFQESLAFGWTLVGILVAGGPAAAWGAFKILPKLPFGRRFHLDPPKLTEQERHAAAAPRTALLGATGEAVSPLRPAGTAVFDGEPVQVVTRGGMIARGARVRVVDLTGNRVIVEEVEGE